MTFGSLFAGIGGMDLGLERAGLQCRWQVEIDDYARRVLEKHWPDIPKHDDVKTFPPTDPGEWHVDLICGGFPCQDISYAGKGAGLAGDRSGLWYEFARIVRDLRPRYVLVENVAALLVRGLDAVLGTLASIGYDAEWECLPASCFGFHHNRDRLFLCAYREGSISRVFSGSRDEWRREFKSRRLASHKAVASWPSQRFEGEPDVAVLVDGVPEWLGRRGAGRGLGNAVVPQVAEWIGQRILEFDRLNQPVKPGPSSDPSLDGEPQPDPLPGQASFL
jgi:DNA (cytosine-5)-methyltransferase 1